MTKKLSDQNMSYREELVNSIERNYILSKKPINRFKINKTENSNRNFDKNSRIIELKKLIDSIQNCNLKKNAKKLIIGDGDINSPIMIIVEDPGLQEEEVGKTFEGESGVLLEKMLEAINIQKKDIFSSYAINFRPPEDRKPTSQEIKKYSIFIKELISIIDPKIVILIGSTAMESVTSSNEKISNERGKWKEIILRNKTYPLMITFSPSYLLRFPENKKFSWEDLKRIRQKILDLKIKF